MKAKHNRKIMKMNKENTKSARGEETGLRDILLPIIVTVSILPFVVFLTVYRTGLSAYDWYSNNDVVYDFFTYYKSGLFLVLSVISLIILFFYLPLYKEKCKRTKVFLPLGILTICVLLSFTFSHDKMLSIKGGIYSFETVFVILSYMIITFFTYQLMQSEHDYVLLSGGFLVLMIGMFVIGFFQFFGKDLLDMEWVQRLVMSAQLEERYLGKMTDTFSQPRVYLTMFNPNYAAQFLAMQAVFLWCFLLTEKVAKKKVLWSVCILLCVLLLYKTYSRMGLAALAFGCLAAYVVRRPYKKKLLLVGCSVVVAGSVFWLAGSKLGISILHRDPYTIKEPNIESMQTDENGIYVTYKGMQEMISFQNFKNSGDISADSPEQKIKTAAEETVKGKQTLGEISKSGKAKISCFGGEGSFYVEKEDGSDILVLSLDGSDWKFVYENGLYEYINSFGKKERLAKVIKVNLHGYETFASGRGYIWSRTIPLLFDVKTALIGCGPENFITAFPQTDYVGKKYYCHNRAMVIDRPHCGYLQIMVQLGLPAFLCLLFFVVSGLKGYMKCHLRMYPGLAEIEKKGQGKDDNLLLSDRIGYACAMAVLVYLVSLLTNDITILVMPLVCVLFGIVLAKGEKSFSA